MRSKGVSVTTQIITLTGVSKSYKKRSLASDASLAITEGKSYGVVGPNGSGKSVLFSIMCGFVLPDSGAVSIAPEVMGKRHSFSEQFGISINGPGCLANATARQNLMRLARIQRVIEK